MITILGIMLFLIFCMLGGIHFYWALGGKWGFENALPAKLTGEKVLNPKQPECVIVGLGLVTFALLYLVKIEMIAVSLNLPEWIYWVIPAIFIARAIGDFKYAGFFKSIRQTTFGKMDTLYYSPLCLMIGTLGILVQIV